MRQENSGEELANEENLDMGAALAVPWCKPTFAQKMPEGICEGYDGEWLHVSQQLVALAEATPPEKFAWRPEPGVRSTSEVYMHIAIANFYLLSVRGPKMPADLKEDAEKTVTSKAEVISWLKRSLEAVKQAHLAEHRRICSRKVHIVDRDGTVGRICGLSYTRTSTWDNWWHMRA